jgi:hypothetical protein
MGCGRTLDWRSFRREFELSRDELAEWLRSAHSIEQETRLPSTEFMGLLEELSLVSRISQR